MAQKYSFKTMWIDDKEMFSVSLLCNGEVVETHTFKGHQDMMMWISDTMAGLQLCGDDWEFECWAHANAMAKEMAKGDDKPKMWCVTYVGLSDSEYKANGYSEVALYATKDAAKAKLKTWRDAEIGNLKDEDRDYEILEDEDDECRISWCAHGEQVRIEIHEVELNK